MTSTEGMTDMAGLAGMTIDEVTAGAESEDAASLATPNAFETTLTVIRDIAELDRLPEPEAELDRDLHLSSFDMIAVCVELEERLGTATDFGKVARARTVKELSRCWEG